MSKATDGFAAWLESRPNDFALPWRMALSPAVRRGAERGWSAGVEWALKEAMSACYAEACISLECEDTANDCAKAIEALLQEARNG